MKCKKCGERVDCEEHGDKYIECDEDLAGNPFYYCVECVKKYQTAFGAITHMHIDDFIEEASKAFGLNVKVRHKSKANMIIDVDNTVQTKLDKFFGVN